MFCTLFEARCFFSCFERKVPQLDSGVRLVRDLKTLVSEIFRVGEKPFLFFGRQDRKTLSPLCFRIPDAFIQKIRRIPVAFQRAGHPETVYMHVSLCLQRMPGIFGGDIFNKTFSAFFTAIKDQPLVKAGFKPFFFPNTLIV